MELIKCGSCDKPITNKTEVEYSLEINEFYCNPDCAKDKYFDYMQSRPIDFENDNDDDFIITKGKLYEKD